jgi:uncharacterized protein
LWAALVLGALWALWHLPELISDPTLQRCRCNSLWILAQFVILAWLYNSMNAILPIVIICHAVINAADRFVLPGGSPMRIIRWCGCSWLGSTFLPQPS